MARRKKNRKKMDGFVFPTPIAGLIVIGAIFGIAYLWLGSCAEALGGQIKELESEHAKLQKRFQNEQYKWTRLKAPRNIEESLAKYGIAMVWPRRDQIVWLADARLADGENLPPRRTSVVQPERLVRLIRSPQHE
jgi:hypothetical protein